MWDSRVAMKTILMDFSSFVFESKPLGGFNFSESALYTLLVQAHAKNYTVAGRFLEFAVCLVAFGFDCTTHQVSIFRDDPSVDWG